MIARVFCLLVCVLCVGGVSYKCDRRLVAFDQLNFAILRRIIASRSSSGTGKKRDPLERSVFRVCVCRLCPSDYSCLTGFLSILVCVSSG